MTVNRFIKNLLLGTLAILGYKIVPVGVRQQTTTHVIPESTNASKSDSLFNEGVLRFNIEKYSALSKYYLNHPSNSVQGAGWKQDESFNLIQGDINLEKFRGDNDYIWQTRGFNPDSILLSYIYVELFDKHKLLNIINEDGSFGVETTEFLSRKWSRDLADSTLEISYLIDCLGSEYLAKARILDIGAGYGRLALRLHQIFPEASLSCTDGILFSSMLCEAYTKEMSKSGTIRVLTLKDLDLNTDQFDIAMNIHSFPEMSSESVAWWLSMLNAKNVTYLFIVPNGKEVTLNDGTDLIPLFNHYNYFVVDQRDKYEIPFVDENTPYNSRYFLFKRET